MSPALTGEYLRAQSGACDDVACIATRLHTGLIEQLAACVLVAGSAHEQLHRTLPHSDAASIRPNMALRRRLPNTICIYVEWGLSAPNSGPDASRLSGEVIPRLAYRDACSSSTSAPTCRKRLWWTPVSAMGRDITPKADIANASHTNLSGLVLYPCDRGQPTDWLWWMRLRLAGRYSR